MCYIYEMDLGGLVNGAAEWTVKNSGSTLGNPFIAALILTIILFIIINALQRDNIKCAIYMFIPISIILFLNYYATRKNLSLMGRNSDMLNAVDSIHVTTGGYSIPPRYKLDDIAISSQNLK